MDAFHRYTRPPHPPPPSAEDPHYHQYHHQQQLLPGAPPTPPSQAPWYANQFQYNASNSQSSSTPPPWPQPPPHANHLNPPMLSSAYPPPPPPPYPGYKPPAQGQFPPRPFPPPPPPQHLNSYPPQEWNNSNWAHQQHWNHPAHNDTEDWAARAKAWATAKASTENHPQQGHYAPSGRQEEQNHYQIQYAQTAESQYTENHQRSPMMSGYPQHPVSTPRPPGQPTHFQEHASTSAGSSSYVPDGSLTYSATEGASNGDQNVAFHPQPLPANPLIHQQEVPSSYSSVSGKEETDQIERRADIPVPAIHEAMHHLHAPIPIGRGMTFPYANHDSMTNLADKPLEFTSRFNHDQNSVPQSGYAYHDSSLPVRGADADIVNTWNSSMAPNVPYSSVPPHFPSVPQHDASIHGLASFSGHSAPPFPRFAGPNFQPTVPSPGGPFVPGAGPPPGFSADAYNLPGISERPKKVPVPNWLREEIIKTKASVTSSSAGHPKYEAQFAEDEGADKSFEKGDQEDSKSIESSRSTEEDDEDEDYVEAAKTAAINQEIKRILTEVLLKVTDELFDEIATKVLNEDDAAADGYKVSPTIQAASTTKASGEGPIFVETKELKKENDSEKSSSSSAGNILGLANYASDDDNNDEEEIHSSKQSDSIKQTHHVESGDEKRLSALHNASENGTSVMKVEEHDTAQANVDRYSQRTSTARNKDSTSNSKMEEPYQLNSPKGSSAAEFGKVNYKRSGTDGQNASRPKELTGLKHNLHDGDVDVRKSLTYNSRDTESMMKSSRKDGTENSSGVESSKEPQSKEDVKLDENHKSKDDKHVRKEKTENYDSEDTKKDCDNVKDGDKIEGSEGRKRSNHPDEREDRKGRERSYRENAGDDRRRERVKDKEEDKHRHKSSHDVSKHKRRRSSSTSSRGRISKDYEVSHAKNSSDGTSDDSRRKGSSRKRNLSRSPSPAKSRRRQVSRSPPHSKHSQRRHSPYSSLDSSRRKRRSRSRSPVRRPR